MKKLILLTYFFIGMLCSNVAQTLYPNPDLAPFFHGVASGDPLTDGVIIWTRITPEEGDMEAVVQWEMAADASFTQPVSSGFFETHAGRDWTVKIDVDGLDADSYYYYRFTAPDGRISMTGRTRTAPASGRDNIRLATASCSSLYSGFFNAYRRIAERNDIDAVVHPGDYIYDFVDQREANRVPEEDILETITNPSTVDGWRALHAYYHLDPDFRAAQQQHPWIILWDNHDIGNDYPENGSMQAFNEWTPVRFEASEPERIYRRVQYGDLLDIFILDINPYRDARVSQFGDEVDDYGRSILGEEQLAWFREGLLDSGAQWRLIVSSKPMAQYHALGFPDLLPVDLPGINDFGIPLSNNSWDGYPREREEIFRLMRDNDIDNNIVVSGDIHAYFYSDLVENPYNPFLYNPNGGGSPVGAEFVTGSVSRVNLDEYVSLPIYPGFGDFVSFLVRLVNPHTIFVDYVNHGYGILDFRPEKTTGEAWLCSKLELTDVEQMAAAFECRDGRNRWHRGRLAEPTESQYEGAPHAPFEAFDWEDLYGRTATAGWSHTEADDFELSGIYPNPARAEAFFRFTTESDRSIEVSLHDWSTGVTVDVLYKGPVMAGNTFVGRVNGAAVPVTGYYTVVVRGTDFVESRKVFISKE